MIYNIISYNYPDMNNIEMRTNMRIKGNKTKNQAIPGAPARHIKLRTHVQNKI
jgi:hypothetical protein